jgi:hypothetical protein
MLLIMHAVLDVTLIWLLISVACGLALNLIGLLFVTSTPEEDYEHIKQCVVGKMCPAGDDWIHVMADHIAWGISNKKRFNWRFLPAILIAGFFEISCRVFIFPLRVFIRL